MLLVGGEISSHPMIVLWAKSIPLAHIGNKDVAAPKSSNKIDSPSKFIASANKR
jgi:hypothetical protein